MNRLQLEHVIRAAATISEDDEVVVIGSQAILGRYPDAPEELCLSADADLYPLDPERADLMRRPWRADAASATQTTPISATSAPVRRRPQTSRSRARVVGQRCRLGTPSGPLRLGWQRACETSTPRRYRFGDFTLSPARRSLRHEGREVPLIPRYFDLLLLLVERRDEALRRQEIFDRVWSDVVVSDGALTQAVRTLRRALGEDGGGGIFIRTVSRHGYQFVCPVTEEDDLGGRRLRPAPRPRARARRGSASADPFAAPARPASRPGDARGRPVGRPPRSCTAWAPRRRFGGSTAPRVTRGRWAHLRDSRWDVPGAGPVPLLEPGLPAPRRGAPWRASACARPSAWWERAGPPPPSEGPSRARRGGRAGGHPHDRSPGPGLAAHLAPPGPGARGGIIAGLGAAGVGSGLAAAEALVRSWRTPALVVLGAVGGGAGGGPGATGRRRPRRGPLRHPHPGPRRGRRGSW